MTRLIFLIGNSDNNSDTSSESNDNNGNNNADNDYVTINMIIVTQFI